MGKLDDILVDELGMAAPDFKQEIKDLFLELIGEDADGWTDYGKRPLSNRDEAQNDLRKELRNMVETL